MRSEEQARPKSFIESARRTQVIAAAIVTVNELGYARASLAQIAARAGIAKSIILYHFANKEELLAEVVQQFYAFTGTEVVAAVEAQTTAAGKLEAYVRTDIDVMARDPAAYNAISDILLSHRDEHGVPLFLREMGADTAYLQSIIAAGSHAGEFAPVDPLVAAVTITYAIDGALAQLQIDPATDLAAYTDQLVPLLLAAVGSRLRE